jgi:hypothetical protein
MTKRAVKSVIFHGKRITQEMPTDLHPGVPLWGVGQSNVRYWLGELPWAEWFDSHNVERNDFYRGIKEARPNAYKWYQKQDGTRPIWLLEEDPTIPGARVLPCRELMEAFATEGRPEERMVTCVIDWMFMKALHTGHKRIFLNGVGANPSLTHLYNHRGVFYWMGVARHAYGCEVIVDEPSIYRDPEKVYGLEGINLYELRRIMNGDAMRELLGKIVLPDHAFDEDELDALKGGTGDGRKRFELPPRDLGTARMRDDASRGRPPKKPV